MIGTWRLMLAMLVVCAHLFHPWWPGAMAVFSFYVISGFLMTLILHEQYTFSWVGLRAFWLNRVLRIYPPYYFACLISIVLIIVFPAGSVSALNHHLHLPTSVSEVLTNLGIFGLLDAPENRGSLVVPGWTLFIELVHYLLISLWAGRTHKTAYCFLLLSLLYVVAVHVFFSGDFTLLYFIVPAGSLPFAVGTMLYFYKNWFKGLITAITWTCAVSGAFALYVLVFALSALIPSAMVVLFYVNIFTTALLLIALWYAPHFYFRKIDKELGDLSYPVYLLHWQAGVLVVLTTGYTLQTLPAFLISIVVVLVLSLLEIRLVTNPIERIRAAVKRRTHHISITTE